MQCVKPLTRASSGGAYLRARADAKPFTGGMYWKTEGAYAYLVRTHVKNRQERLGPRSPSTEAAYATFHQFKKTKEHRLASLTAALLEAQRQNKALRAGAVPSIAVSVLNAVREAGLQDKVLAVGTYALYAYAAAAGVHMPSKGRATAAADLLGDARHRIQLLVDPDLDMAALLPALTGVDASFEGGPATGLVQTARNSKGFEVVLLPRGANAPESLAPSSTALDTELWLEWAGQAGVQAQRSVFEYPVISATGRMATLRTVGPQTFLEIAHALAAQAPVESPEGQRAGHQARLVQALLDEELLMACAGLPTR